MTILQRLFAWTRYGRDELTGLRIRSRPEGGYEYIDQVGPTRDLSLRVRAGWSEPLSGRRPHLLMQLFGFCYLLALLGSFGLLTTLALGLARIRLPDK